jgi:prefoldin subunit 5
MDPLVLSSIERRVEALENAITSMKEAMHAMNAAILKLTEYLEDIHSRTEGTSATLLL